MNDLQRRIDDFETKAAENELIGRLAADPEVRTYNMRLAFELWEQAAKLRCGFLIQPQNESPAAAFSLRSECPEVSKHERDEEKRSSRA